MPRPTSAIKPQKYADSAARRLCSPHTLRPVAPAPTLFSPLPPPRLLLVEHDSGMQASLVGVLAAHYAVESVSDGLAGWYAARRFAPALVIIGLSISAKDRLILTRALRGNVLTATTPIILLCASAERELLLSCLAAGANHFLLKPFAVDELLESARRELQRSMLSKEQHETPSGA